MAKLVGNLKARVDQAGEDEGGHGATCFALPGTAGITPSMSSCHFDVHVAVYDDYSVYVGLNGYITDKVVPNSGYTSAMYISSSNFGFAWDKSHLVTTGANVKGKFEANIDASSGTFRWDMSCGEPNRDSPAGNNYVYVGRMQDFAAGVQGQNGGMWIGGTGTYEAVNPMYPSPVWIMVPGFIEFLDYFPFAIRKSGTMQSCNRNGGSVKIRKSGSWRNVKNVAAGDSSKNKAFVRKSNQWKVAPKIGANAK